MNPSVLIKPYLQEMDDLLKNCEELTGIPFGQSKEEVTMESYKETNLPPQAYLSTSYIDTQMEGAGPEDQPVQGQLKSMGIISNRCGGTTKFSHTTEMPITSAGNKLSETMVEYEGQLLGMLAMLESCMEETGMDFEPQGWATDAGYEYVHISKKTPFQQDTTLVPREQERPVKLETEPMQLESWAAQHAEAKKVSNNSRNGVVGSGADRIQLNHLLGCEAKDDISMERLERSEEIGHRVLEPQFMFSEPSQSYTFNKITETKGDMNETKLDDTEMSAEECLDPTDAGSGKNELGELGSRMEECIEEVKQLEKRRKELLTVVLELRGNKNKEQEEGRNKEEEVTEEHIDSKVAELMTMLKSEEEGRREERKKEIQSLREMRAEEERRLWKVNLERQGLQEELRKLKRMLFIIARDCTHSQASLNNQRREVELLRREEEKLQSLLLQLTEEGWQLRSAHQQQLLQLQTKIHAQSSSQTSNTQEELTECRRHSCGDIQQYLQGGLRALEDRYEPILLALLKRREAAAGALVKAKEQAQELRAQLKPLREEIQKLNLQRACLEEKLKLIQIHRKEDLGQYKETVYCLEENSRELKTELNIQKKKTKEIEELRDSLTKQLLLYRSAIEDHNNGNHGEKT
ncbi:syncoilin isoform X2 [Echeneis naucrates]|nr:syncoilin-like isoform X2 [Echeneis naucrates]